MNAIVGRDWRCGLWALVCAFGLVISGCGGGGGSSGAEPTPVPQGLPGTLDTSFGVGGIVTTSVGGHAQVNAVALQPDGKILAAGYDSVGGGLRQILLVRYTVDGNLDSGFGAGGKVLSSPYPGDAEAVGVALQPDGKIVVLGTGSPGALVRYTKDGLLDSSFGVGGIVVGGAGVAVAAQSDGKIVVARSESGNQIGALRFNVDGTADSSFGFGGEALAVLPPTSGGSTSAAPSIAIQSDGKILVGGSRDVSFFGGVLHYSSVVRLDTKGVLDPTFGQGGFDKGSLEEGLAAIVLQPDGKILAEVVGGGVVGPIRTVSRLLPDGTLDPAFGIGGTASGIGGLLAVQANGKIVTAETTSVGAAPSLRVAFRLSRYDTTGALDTSFGSGGTVVTLIEANNAVGAVAIQPDGRIVVAGHETTNTDPSFPQSAIVNVAVARYFGDPVTTSSP